MIQLEINSKIKKPLLSPSALRNLASITGKKEKKVKGIVELNLIGDGEMTKLNFQFRGKKYPTDVLSFPWAKEALVKSPYLGQIYICQNQIVRQAKEMGVNPKEEFSRMFVHGLLHLSGHEHVDIKKAKIMFNLQEGVLKKAKYVS